MISKKLKNLKKYFHLSNDQKVIISVGWLFERKGFDTFCEVASSLPEYILFGLETLIYLHLQKRLEN